MTEAEILQNKALYFDRLLASIATKKKEAWKHGWGACLLIGIGVPGSTELFNLELAYSKFLWHWIIPASVALTFTFHALGCMTIWLGHHREYVRRLHFRDEYLTMCALEHQKKVLEMRIGEMEPLASHALREAKVEEYLHWNRILIEFRKKLHDIHMQGMSLWWRWQLIDQ